ncbi:MAG: hypothetical protein AAFV93_02585 [Chloroflexota bacterium]
MTIWQSDEIETLKPKLEHILWIGGATDAGKTTTARLLGEKLKLPVYHGDQTVKQHWAELSPDKQPAMYKFSSMTMDDR